MKSKTTKLSFEAEIGKVTVTSAKKEQYGTTHPGVVELALRVEMPVPPRKPSCHSNHIEPGTGWSPAAPVKWRDYSSNDPKTYVRADEKVAKKVKGEDDEAFEKRKAAYEARLASITEKLPAMREEQANDKAEYARALAAWDRQMAALRERQMAWAMLPGLSALFSGNKLNVVLTPCDQDVLPGFMLTVPAEQEETPLLDYPDVTDLSDEEIDELTSANKEGALA